MAQPVSAHARAAGVTAVLLLLLTAGVVAGAGADDAADTRIAVAPVTSSSTSTTTTTTTAPATTTTTITTTAPPTTTAAPTPAPSGLTPLTISPPQHEGTYDRDEFGDWIDADGDCQNTRAEVLIAESEEPVSFTNAGGCTVAGGLWVDPWTLATTTTASAFDIDHTVPLANAWRSGAWSWTRQQRVAFANDLTYADHLIAMDASANRSKGDRGPEGWRPPRSETWCRYAMVWSEIKGRWNLTATQAEWNALVEMASTC